MSYGPHLELLCCCCVLYCMVMMDACVIVNEFYICLVLNVMKGNPETSYFPLM